MARGSLCTLQDVKTVSGIKSNNADTQITELIGEVSEAVHDFCAPHEFIADTEDKDRFYPVSDVVSNEIQIDPLSDDPSSVSVVDTAGNVINAISDAIMLPRNRQSWEPITAIRFISDPSGYEIKVTGKYGWPSVPERVKNATIETVRDWMRYTQALQTQDRVTTGGPSAFADRELPDKAKKMLTGIRGYRIA